MKKKIGIVIVVCSIVMMAITLVADISYAKRGGEGGRGNGPVIYVENQGLYYDSIVTASPLPYNGPFQKLYECPPGLLTDLCTENGPGDTEYYGGRWWMDTNNNGEMDETDSYFSCPLLPPGREAP
jgi:hypothetical protein